MYIYVCVCIYVYTSSWCPPCRSHGTCRECEGRCLGTRRRACCTWARWCRCTFGRQCSPIGKRVRVNPDFNLMIVDHVYCICLYVCINIGIYALEYRPHPPLVLSRSSCYSSAPPPASLALTRVNPAIVHLEGGVHL